MNNNIYTSFKIGSYVFNAEAEFMGQSLNIKCYCLDPNTIVIDSNQSADIYTRQDNLKGVALDLYNKKWLKDLCIVKIMSDYFSNIETIIEMSDELEEFYKKQ